MGRYALAALLVVFFTVTALNTTDAAELRFKNDSYHKVFFIDIDWKTQTCSECGSLAIGPGYSDTVDDWFSTVNSIHVTQYKCCKNNNDICTLTPFEKDYYKYIGEGCIPQGGYLTNKGSEGSRTSRPPGHNVANKFKILIDSHRISWKKLN